MSGCCFTGHRMIPWQTGDRLRILLAGQIRELYRAGIRDFYAGGALGFDMMAEETVCRLKENDLPQARLHLILPCTDQDARWNNTDRSRYRELLARADSVRYITQFYCPGVMAARNRELVASATVCIAYLTHAGGTAQTVSMAREAGRRIINLADLLA